MRAPVSRGRPRRGSAGHEQAELGDVGLGRLGIGSLMCPS